MLKAKLTDKVFIFKGTRYFSAGAENIQLGTYGRKSISPIAASRLDAAWRFQLDNALIERVEPISIELETKKSLNAKTDVGLKAADGSGDITIEKFRDSSLVVIKFHILSGPLSEAFNKNTPELKKLNDIKRNSRIANQIFVVVSAETARKMTSAINLQAKTVGNNIEIVGSLENMNETKISIAAGTTLAYGLVQPVWMKNKLQIESLRTDQHGPG